MNLLILNVMFLQPTLKVTSGIMTDLLSPCTTTMLIKSGKLVFTWAENRACSSFILHVLVCASLSLKLLVRLAYLLHGFSVECSSVHQITAVLHPIEPNFRPWIKSSDVIRIKSHRKVQSIFPNLISCLCRYTGEPSVLPECAPRNWKVILSCLEYVTAFSRGGTHPAISCFSWCWS